MEEPMKNALVLEDHYGDDGAVRAGGILRDVTTKRFEELEKKGLVRTATDAEVKVGDQHAFEKDESGEAGEKKAPESGNKKAAEPKNKEA
jgi:hypothetical protein